MPEHLSSYENLNEEEATEAFREHWTEVTHLMESARPAIIGNLETFRPDLADS